MSVNDRNPGPEQKTRYGTHATAEIHIFHVEKESLIESANRIQNGTACKHETTREHRDICGLRMVERPHIVAIHSIAKEPIPWASAEPAQQKVDG